MPTKKGKKPWWYSPSVWEVMLHPDLAKESKLHPLILTKIASTLAEKPFPYDRPKHAGPTWIEAVTVDGIEYQLSCCVDEYQNREFIVLKSLTIHRRKNFQKR